MKNIVLSVSACLFTSGAFATIALVPQPTSLRETGGWCENSAPVVYKTDAALPPEGYRLSVTESGITVTSADEAGRFYAKETLKQLVDGDAKRYPCVEIEDAPRYSWRGVHFDDCRHFFGKEEVLRTMDLMKMHKLNRFHWHLTEDQGWRLDIPGYPELVKYGAVRSSSPLHGTRPHFSQPKVQQQAALDGRKYGPFYYTEADVKEVVAYAKARHIEIVPEIELPGHFQAVLAGYPEFACQPDPANRDPLCVWGISENVMCLGNDKAIKFMEDVLDYVTKLFPYEVVHIGGDECPMTRWKTCPKCQARIKSEKLGDEHGLQPWITRHFVKFLEARGKRALGWDEYLLGDVPQSAIGMSWRVGSGGAGHKCLTPGEWAAKGHDMVMTPFSHCYLDYGQGLKDDPFQYIGGKLPLEKVYSLDPCAGVAEKDRAHILGGQGNNWSEYTWNEYDLEWKMWPRMSALAEVFWTGEKRPAFANFKERMRTHRARLIARHVNCAPLD